MVVGPFKDEVTTAKMLRRQRRTKQQGLVKGCVLIRPLWWNTHCWEVAEFGHVMQTMPRASHGVMF